MTKWPKNKLQPSGPQETHLRNIRQLTFGGQNAEAYWDVTGTKIVYQTRQPEFPDEQIFVMDADGGNKRLVSTGFGRCTCSYFSPDGKWIYFSSTHDKNKGAQAPLDMSKGYLWKVNPEMSLFRVPVSGGKPELIINKDNYVAETTIAPNGEYMTFTGAWNGDIDIYRSDLDGKNIRPLITFEGYDGGPFVSWDSKKIVFRRQPSMSDQDKADFHKLLSQHLVRPSRMDIWIMDSEGNYAHRVTDLGGASFAPFMHPDGKRIIFASNHHDPRGREFDLFIVNKDGTGLEQVTFTGDFDGFPMFTKDGKKLIWGSNRHGTVRGETNIFVADWKD